MYLFICYSECTSASVCALLSLNMHICCRVCMCELESGDFVYLLVHIPHSDSHSTKDVNFKPMRASSGWA